MWFGDEHLVEIVGPTVDSAIVFGCTQPMTKTTIIASLSLFSLLLPECATLGRVSASFSASVLLSMCGQPFGIYCCSSTIFILLSEEALILWFFVGFLASLCHVTP